MESATSKVASQCSKSPRNTGCEIRVLQGPMNTILIQVPDDGSGIHKLRKAKIVGIIHLILAYLAFNLSLILPVALVDLNHMAEWLEVIAKLVFAPIGVTIVLLLIGIAKRRAFYLVPFFVVCIIATLVLWSTVIPLAFFMDWRDVDGNMNYDALAGEAVLVICACLEAWSLIIVCRGFDYLYGLRLERELRSTVKKSDCKLKRDAKIVGIMHFILAYLAYNLCHILPLAFDVFRLSADWFKLAAVLVFMPIGFTTVCFLVGLSKRRPSLLLPFLAFCSISFILQAVVILMGGIFMPWLKFKFAGVKFLAFLSFCACLEYWSLGIVYLSYRRLRGVKPDAEPRNLRDSRLDTHESRYPLV